MQTTIGDFTMKRLLWVMLIDFRWFLLGHSACGSDKAFRAIIGIPIVLVGGVIYLFTFLPVNTFTLVFKGYACPLMSGTCENLGKRYCGRCEHGGQHMHPRHRIHAC